MTSDPFASALVFAAHLALTPSTSPGDPGPDAACPNDMRRVRATHHDEVQHLCVSPQKDTKDTHCYAYFEGLTALEGAVTPIDVCMDQYEAPNKKGARPLVMQSFESASRYCKGRGKRVCSEQEWETACEGPQHLPWQYGWVNDKRVCHSDRGWKQVDFAKFAEGGEVARKESDRLWQGSGSGTRPGCVSPFGIFDMMGNVEEWVASRSSRKFPGSLMGGFWAKPWTGCRGTNDAHEPTFVFYETGFRCCADPGTLDTDGTPVRR